MSREEQNTSFGKRQLVIYHRKRGKNCREIARLLMTKKSTVADVIKRYKEEDSIEFKKQKGK